MAGEAPEPTMDELDLGRIFAALADPSRRKVVSDLLNEPVGTVRTCWSFELPVAKSTLSHHFKVLRESGLVSSIDLGNRREVVLRKEELDQRFPGLLALVKDDRV
ncbi:ArsR/SmtB family transcription factor [Nocardiopsis chromatogenes]|uniref:ArsR/SmtB family transcription factor n=1 Tax=Nocardiopsis chromatogenes TaxID=280239 RepID=UPI00034BB2D0|nr:ArsR family transcriptional regulator [Nocardiopsis chromatogenes]